MGKVILRRGDVKTITYYGKVQSEKRQCKNNENTMGQLNLRRGNVKTMKLLWESSISEEAM